MMRFENDAGDTEGLHFPALFDDLIRGLLINVRHRADFLTDLAAGANEHGIDEPGGGQIGFAHKSTEGFGAAEAARAMRWERHWDEISVAQTKSACEDNGGGDKHKEAASKAGYDR